MLELILEVNTFEKHLKDLNKEDNNVGYHKYWNQWCFPVNKLSVIFPIYFLSGYIVSNSLKENKSLQSYKMKHTSFSYWLYLISMNQNIGITCKWRINYKCIIQIFQQ